MPKVSIILPTYNRADTLPRALRSVQQQTFQDWELIVVDDGSTDGTAALLADFDSRLKVVWQSNQGVTRARNTALQHCHGEYLAFLDSDDEWLPFHLELCLAFLTAHPEAQVVSCALREDFGPHRQVNHYQVELQDWYPKVARLVGSRQFELPAGEADYYRTIYNQRVPLGAWSQAVLEPAVQRRAGYYSGQIFEHWRWGFLMWLPTTVVRRSVIDQLGYFDLSYPICSDYVWLAELCRHCTAHFLSVVTGIKHELRPDGRPLAEGHIAKGKTQHTGAEDLLRYFEQAYWQRQPESAELTALRSHKQLYTAQVLLEHGLRDRALTYLKAAQPYSPQPWRVVMLKCFATLILSDALCQLLYALWCRAGYTLGLVHQGEIDWHDVAGKLLAKFMEGVPV
jgi:glycosyltransferase involved in cell wall biosynthesis